MEIIKGIFLVFFAMIWAMSLGMLIESSKQEDDNSIVLFGGMFTGLSITIAILLV
jgi:hypothetical protein